MRRDGRSGGRVVCRRFRVIGPLSGNGEGSREISSSGGATQPSGNAKSGTIPTAKSPAHERSSAARPTPLGLGGENGCHLRNAPSTRGKERSSSRVDRTAGSTVANGSVAKRKYSPAPNSGGSREYQFPTNRLRYSKDHQKAALTGKRGRNRRVGETRRDRPMRSRARALTRRMKATQR